MWPYVGSGAQGADLKAALAKTVAAFGWLDFAFNNAGIEPRKPAPTAECEEEERSRIIDTNLRGVFLCTKHETPLILKQGGGAVGWRHRACAGHDPFGHLLTSINLKFRRFESAPLVSETPCTRRDADGWSHCSISVRP